jgi:hypothetical protein
VGALVTTITLSADLPKGVYTLVPVATTPPVTPPASSVLWATSFLPPASLGPLVNEWQPIGGLSALPWGSPPLAIQCLGPASEHAHSIVTMPDGSHALHLRMLAGSGYDQAALIVQPTKPVASFHYRARVMLDPKLGTLLQTDGVNNWIALSEYKTGGFPPDAYGGDFRAALGVQRSGDGALHFIWACDTNANDPNVTYTTYKNSGYVGPAPVPGKWTVLELSKTPTTIEWSIDSVSLGVYTGPQGVKSMNRFMLANNYGVVFPRDLWITDISLSAAPP